MKANDGLLLPILKPEIAGNPAVVLVHPLQHSLFLVCHELNAVAPICLNIRDTVLPHFAAGLMLRVSLV
jgi:hypothetical protein